MPLRHECAIFQGAHILAQHIYECMFLVDPNRYSRDSAGVAKKVDEMIEKCGGELLVSRLWAEQRLAYPVKGHKKGIYWMTYFRLDSTRHPELHRATQLNTDVLRAMVIKLDPRIAGVMVEHAKSAKPTASTDGEIRRERPAREEERVPVRARAEDEEE
jgi:small subunit ribosomal protein S6